MSRIIDLCKVRNLIYVLIFLIIVPFIYSFAICRIYTPPTLTRGKVILINALLPLFKKYPNYDYWVLSEYDDTIGPLALKEMRNSKSYQHFLHFSATSEVYQDFQLFYIVLKELKINTVKKFGPAIILITKSFFFKSEPPGLLYMIDNTNPNDITNVEISKYKPFKKIAEHWYVSKTMIDWNFNWQSGDLVISIPSSLYDYSSDTSEVADLLKRMDN